MKHEFIYDDENFIYYDPEDIGEILRDIPKDIVSKRKTKYYTTITSFDIESTSYFKNDNKFAFMYMWSFAIEDYVIIGRTWEQFVDVCNAISDTLVCYSGRRFVVWIHNESWEFQFFRKWFEWEKVFSLDKRVPILGVTTTGIEFRCSYRLSGYALANLPTKSYKKLVGALNYELVRHYKTPLDNQTLAYSIRDVQTVVEYIRDKVNTDGAITHLPMTKTGYVRIECRKSCFGEGKHGEQYDNYHSMISRLTLFPEEYEMNKDAFQGGFTHANAYYVRLCEKGINGKHYLENVGSMDITSDYPAEMVAENGYPMSKGRYYKDPSRRLVEQSIRDYFCILDITFEGLEDIVHIDNPLSESRCTEVVNAITNNGRVVSADKVRTTITHIDLEIFNACYKYKRYKVHRLIRYKRGYLPTEFIRKVLEFYGAKTELKGETGEENERRYLWGKENVNSTFGCAVTDVCQPLIEYTPELEKIWTEQPVNIESELNKYNKHKNRFLFYPWGVAITAFARRRLWGVILACGWDYVYSDTDSVKILNPEKHIEIFKKSDAIITEKLRKAVEYHGLKWEDVAPKNRKGEPKQLGLWEWEHTYTKFRTCGAKRYIVEYPKALDVKQPDGTIKYYDLSLTVSGLNKRTAIPYLLEKYGSNDEVFKHFTQGLTVPPPYSGRMISYYIDDPIELDVIDFLGNKAHVVERSGIALEGTSYTMDYNDKYEQYQSYIWDWFGIGDPHHIIEKKLSVE